MKTMKIDRDSKEVHELLGLVYSSSRLDKIDITKSSFYKAIQQVIDLDATRIFFNIGEPAEEVMLLLAKIAATSPTLQTVCLNENHFGKYGSEVAAAFASAPAIKKVSMDSCIFNTGGCAETVAVFEKHNLMVKEGAPWDSSLDLMGDEAYHNPNIIDHYVRDYNHLDYL